MKFSKMLIILGICCVAGLLLVYGVHLHAQYSPKKDNIATKVDEGAAKTAMRMEQFRNRQQGSNWTGQRNSQDSESKDNSDYYKVIVDNSLFRPLGWRPPKNEPEYAYRGSKTDENGRISKAYVLERRSGKLYTAMVGDKVGDAVVKEIQEKQIVLDKNGEQITLRGGDWQSIKSGGSSRRSASSRSEANNNDSNNQSNASSKNDAALAKAKQAFMKSEQMRKEMMERAQQMRRRFEGASRDQRERMIREFSGRRRGRGDR